MIMSVKLIGTMLKALKEPNAQQQIDMNQRKSNMPIPANTMLKVSIIRKMNTMKTNIMKTRIMTMITTIIIVPDDITTITILA